MSEFEHEDPSMEVYFKRETEHIDFADVPPIKEIEMRLPSEQVTLRIGQVAVALFRYRPECNYVAVTDGDVHVWFNEFMVNWVGGLTPTDNGYEHTRNRYGKSFADYAGWGPRLIIDDYPTEAEVDVWVQRCSYDLDIPGAFEKQVEEEEEGEDGGWAH